MVIKVEMKCDRCRSKALALVAAARGVHSVALAGDARDQLVVAGEDVDSVKLAGALRRKVGPAQILTVDTEAAKKEGGGGDKKPPAAAAAPAAAVVQYVPSALCYQYAPPQAPVSFVYEPPATGYAVGYHQPRYDDPCSIIKKTSQITSKQKGKPGAPNLPRTKINRLPLVAWDLKAQARQQQQHCTCSNRQVANQQGSKDARQALRCGYVHQPKALAHANPSRPLSTATDVLRPLDTVAAAWKKPVTLCRRQTHTAGGTEMLIRLQGVSEKGHAKAMQVAAAVDGVESVTLSGKDKSLLRVVGEGVDCNHLTTRLRRKVGRADVVELHTLNGGAGGYYGGYGSSYSRSGSGLSRADATFGYSASYPTTTARGGYAPEYYGGGYGSHHQQPPASYGGYGYYSQPAYGGAPTVVHHDQYYTSSTDPNGCCIM
ncbi:hypothetical protein HU200_062444 [Digitaria exilis]|uniref:HMA domain-containing protein n=1 Tax=Digitaria exilis TaxID=1010633 RepID=A0A835A2Y5_9POAL|nr:hypothetical protein HU200_062444 [Digitaria exilis]